MYSDIVEIAIKPIGANRYLGGRIQIFV